MSEPSALEGVVTGLLLAENLGDIHDQWNLLCRAAGTELDGNYLQGFFEGDEEKLVAAIRHAAVSS